jgi:hypothetical protein
MGCMHAPWNEKAHLPSGRLALTPPGGLWALVGGGAAGPGVFQPRRAHVHAPIRGCTVGRMLRQEPLECHMCASRGWMGRWPGCRTVLLCHAYRVASHRRLPQHAERQCMICAAWLAPNRPLHSACPVAAPVQC